MGFELDRLMKQYGVATPSLNYSGTGVPIDPGVRPVATDTLTGDDLTKAQANYDNLLSKYNLDKANYPADQALYNTYKTEYQNRMLGTPQYMQAQFQTGNEPQSAAYKYATNPNVDVATGQGMGVKQYHSNIQDWATKNPTANTAAINAYADKYGISGQDIYNATNNRWGNTLQVPKYGTATVTPPTVVPPIVTPPVVEPPVVIPPPVVVPPVIPPVVEPPVVEPPVVEPPVVEPTVETPLTILSKPIVSDIPDEISPTQIPLIPAPDILETIPSIYTKPIVTDIPDTVDTNIPLIIPETPLELPDFTVKTPKEDKSFFDDPDFVEYGPSRGLQKNPEDLPEEFDKYLVDGSVVDNSYNLDGSYDFRGSDYDSFGGGGGGGGCPAPWVNILLANGETVKAGDIKVGMQVYTRHENKDEWGVYPVTAVAMGEDNRYEVILEDGRTFVGTFNHRVCTDADWVEIQNLKAGDKLVQQNGYGVVKSSKPLDFGPIVKITIDDAHTYITEGFLSHNIKIQDFASSNLYAKGGRVKTHFQTGGVNQASDIEQMAENYGVAPQPDIMSYQGSKLFPMQAPAPVSDQMTRRDAFQTPPQQPMDARATQLDALLRRYAGDSTDYSAELAEARKRSDAESLAFQKMIQTAMKGTADEAPSKAEMYFRLASAFGSPTKTGHFAEALGNVNKELAAYSKEERDAKKAQRALQLQLGLKGQEMRMATAKDDLTTLKTLAAEGMKDKRAITAEVIKDFIKSGEPESAAGKQAKDEGLKVGTPEFKARVAEIAQTSVDAKLAQVNATLAGMSVQQANQLLAIQKFENLKSQQAKLGPAEMKLKTEVEDILTSTDQAMLDLKRAYQLNPNTFDTSLGDVAQRKVLETAGSKDPKVIATREQTNLLSKSAVGKLKTAFGGNPTEGERKILLDMEGIDAKSKEERAIIMRNSYMALKARREREQKRLNEINQGLYRDTSAPTGELE